MRWPVLILFALATTLFMPCATAQSEANLVRVEVEVDQTELTLPMKQLGQFIFTVRDTSEDNGNRVGVPAGELFFHSIRFEVSVANGDGSGWIIVPPSSYMSVGGNEQEVPLLVTPTPQLRDRVIEINFTTVIEGQLGSATNTQVLRVETLGFSSLSVTAGGVGEPLAPREVRDVDVKVTNNALFPRSFLMEVRDTAACGLTIIPTREFVLAPKETGLVGVSIQAPSDKPLYLNDDCPLTVTVTDANDPGITASTNMGATINGSYIDPVWVFWALAAVIALILLLILLARRKAIIEEEILGKPQRPWTIPVERVYLQHLEARDARAAYVVRHFLMEEEYKSALLWYQSYKSATKGTRAKEGLVISQEKTYKRFQKKWARKIAAPVKKSDRFATRLQKKLDRQAKATVRKDRRTWKKRVKKLEKRHAKKEEKLLAAWEKAAQKAAKRGEPAPAKPDAGQPDIPAKPELQKVLLADHKWQKKADRKQRRMVKKQGNLEVRFEKKDARRLVKVRRKVNKIARKIDDPEFAAEHPLLAENA